MTFLQLIAPIYYNVKQYGALGDGSTDDTTAIAAASSAASSAGGGTVFLPPGTYISGNQTLYAHVFFVGAGKTATTIKLKNGANTDLFSAQTGSISLSASFGSGSQGTLYDFGFMNLTLDGNKANQTGGPSYPLRFYGYSYILENIEVKNGYSGSIISDWNSSNTVDPGDSMISQWVNVKTHYSGGLGIEFGGPHDSEFVNLEVFCEGQTGLHLAPNATGCKFSQTHVWGSGFPSATAALGSAPNPLYGYDNFTRANAASWGTAQDGQTWANNGSLGVSISSNKGLVPAVGTGSMILGTHSETAIDVIMTFNMAGDINSTFGPTWRYTDMNNNYHAVVYNGVLYVEKYVSGSKTTLASQSFAFSSSTTGRIHIQMYGAQYRASIWQDGTLEPATWQISGSDSSFSSGNFGVKVLTNAAAQGYTTYFAATTPTPITNVLCEAPDVFFDNCTSDTNVNGPHVVALNSGFKWKGGWLECASGVTAQASGFQIGMAANDVAYQNQVYASGGLATAKNPTICELDCRVQGMNGKNGALFLRNDGGLSRYRLMIDANSGALSYTGTKQATSLIDFFTADQFGNQIGTDVLQLSGGVQVATSSTLWSGSGAPSSGLGSNGDFYFRDDTPGTSNQRLYVKSSGSWTGIL